MLAFLVAGVIPGVLGRVLHHGDGGPFVLVGPLEGGVGCRRG
jgi:hypothetical protein